MKLASTSALVAVALLGACGIGAPQYPSFENAAYRVTGRAASPDGAGMTPTVIYRDGPKMRVETTLPDRGLASIVYDQSTDAAYVLSATAPAPSVAPPTMPIDPAAGASTMTPADPALAPPAPVAAPALGVAVKVAGANAPQALEAPWAALGAENARSVGACSAAGEEGQEWRPRATEAGDDRVACITSDGIVLRVRDGEHVIFEATQLERGPQDPALFTIPAGYQIVDPEAVVDQVGDTLDQLDSVNSATPTAPTPSPQTN